MNTVIENNFFELQKQTTHVIVEQKVIVSEQEEIDNFLDKIINAKEDHKRLVSMYRETIEVVVSYIESSREKSDLLLLTESIHSLVATTKRLIKSFGDGKLKECFLSQIKEYKLLLADINEVLLDIENRITGDKEAHDLLEAL
jgi:hypothetical protein